MQIPQFCSGNRNIAHGATRLSGAHYHAALVVSSYVLPCHCISQGRTLRYSPPAATTNKSRNFDRTVVILSRIGALGLHSAAGHRLVTTEAQVRSYGSLCDICGGKSDTGVGFSRNTSARTVNLHSTSTAYLFMYRPEDGQLA